MATPTTPETWALAAKAIKRYHAEHEATVRDLLGQWVSGLEPELIYSVTSGLLFVAGLAVKGDPTCALVVENPRCPPKSPSFLRSYY